MRADPPWATLAGNGDVTGQPRIDPRGRGKLPARARSTELTPARASVTFGLPFWQGAGRPR